MRVKKILFLIILHFSYLYSVAQNVNQPAISGPLGVTVSSYSGNLNFSRTDLLIKSRKLDLEATFYYNSSNFNYNTGYGKGWTYKYNMKYIPDSNGVFIEYQNGYRAHFKRTAASSNSFTSPVGIFDSLTEYTPGKYLLISKDYHKYYFDNAQHKRLTRMEERNGVFLNFTYTDTLLTQLADLAGRTLTFAYSNGRLTQITDANGTPRTVQYAYDGTGNLISVTDPAGNTTRYKYIINGPLRAITDKNQNTLDIIYNSDFAVKELISCNTAMQFSYVKSSLTTYVSEEVSGKKQITIYKYDANGNVISKTGNCCGYQVTYQYDAANNVTSVTDANGNRSEFIYDSKGNMVRYKDALGKSSLYEYDQYANLTSYTNRNGNTTSFVYDSNGNLTSAVYPLNLINSNTFASNGDRLSSTDGNGNTTSYSYDMYGNLTGIQQPLGINSSFTYNTKSQLISYTDPRGNTTSYSYDLLDRLTTVVNAMGGSKTMTYDANGNITEMRDEKNNQTTYSYDASNRVVAITNAMGHSQYISYDEKGNITSVKNENGQLERYTYDNLNRLTSKTNPMNEITSYSYDGKDNVTTIQLPNGNSIRLTYDALDRRSNLSDNIGQIMSLEYDAVGNLIRTIDGLGNASNFAYDALDRLISATDALGHSIEKAYDKSFNLISYTDKLGKRKTFSYDALNRPINFTDALNASTSFTYDAAGNLTAVTDANNNTNTYVYDALNRNTMATFANGTTNLFTYDAVGNLISFQDHNGAVTAYIFDNLYQLTKKDYPGANDDNYSYDNTGKVISATNNDAAITLSYDNSGRVTFENLNGKVTAYQYDISANKKETIYPSGKKISYSFDGRNRLVSVADSSRTLALYGYDLANRLKFKNYTANNLNTNYTYNANGNMLNISVNPGNIINSSYQYDANGNLLMEIKTHNLNKSKQYVYDDEMRLINFKQGVVVGNSIPVPLKQIQYNYDLLGNRTSIIEDSTTTVYSVNSVNAYTSIGSGLNTNLQYDNNGNVIYDGINSYSYNYENQLLKANNGSLLEYKYDAFGRRTSKKVSSGTTLYTYSGFNEIEFYDIQGSLKTVKIYGSNIDEIISSYSASTNDLFYHNDRLGSVELITNVSGAAVEKYEYDPFGSVQFYQPNNQLLQGSSFDNQVLFTGASLDTEINMYYYRARSYNYKHGRFSQRDPYGYAAGDINLYSYVKNMPTRFVDPFGTDCHTPEADFNFIQDAVLPGYSIYNNFEINNLRHDTYQKIQTRRMMSEKRFGDSFRKTRSGLLGIIEENKVAIKGARLLGGILALPDVMESALNIIENGSSIGKATDLAMSIAGVMAFIPPFTAVGVGLGLLSTAYGLTNIYFKSQTGLTVGQLIFDDDYLQDCR